MFFFNLISSGLDASTILIAGLSFVVVVAFSVVMHEISHGWVAYWNGDPTAKVAGRLTMNPVAHFNLVGLLMFFLVGFGWAKPVPVNTSNFKNYKKGMITVSIAGVTTNFLLAGVGLLLLYLLAPLILFTPPVNALSVVMTQLVSYILIFGIQINFMLGLFNLLPIYPLDGYNLINTFLPYNNRFQMFMVRYGFLVLLGVILLGRFGDMMGFPYLNIFRMFSELISKIINKVIIASVL